MSNKFKNPWDDEDKSEDKTPKKDDSDNKDFEELLKQGQEKLLNFFQAKKNKMDGGGSNFSNLKIPPHAHGKMAIVLLLVAFVLWLFTGFYTVQPDEEGVVIRFGKYSRTALPGLNYKLPNPIETVDKLSVTRINKEEVGFRSSGKRITSRAQLLENTVSNESQMLTTDENIVDINFEVQWVISDAKDFLFNVRDLAQENTVKGVAESAMREIIGLSQVSDVLAEERSKIEQQAKQLMQSMLDNYRRGVKIVRVQLLRVDPPQEVIEAYRDVQNAKQDKELEINKALSYRNDIVPRARGEGERVLQDAEAYKQKVIAEATGEAQRFSLIYEEYKNARDVTRKKMYLEAMEEVLSKIEKVIIDNKSSGIVPYLALPDMNKSMLNKSN